MMNVLNFEFLQNLKVNGNTILELNNKNHRQFELYIKVRNQKNYFKSFYFAESSRVVYSQGETKRLSSAWCK